MLADGSGFLNYSELAMLLKRSESLCAYPHRSKRRSNYLTRGAGVKPSKLLQQAGHMRTTYSPGNNGSDSELYSCVATCRVTQALSYTKSIFIHQVREEYILAREERQTNSLPALRAQRRLKDLPNQIRVEVASYCT